jgi:ubiquinone/menaquinone biosynthesis C-methylase UbiE
MNKQQAGTYICPATGSSLELHVDNADNERIIDGAFVNSSGTRYPIRNGLPDFTWPLTLHTSDAQTRDSYESMADDYDQYASLPFITYRADEHAVRENMVDLLELQPDSRVLEIGCGTGRGATHLAARLGEKGSLYLQEISPKLLAKAIEKLEAKNIRAECSIANGSYLPFPDGFFDAAHHFGGINTFAEIPRCLAELARVVKPGGKIVIGDEGLGPWLTDSEFGRIMANSNPLLKCKPPMDALPVCATDVRLEYFMMGAFYLIEFRVAEGEPQPDYHMMIPSARGGNHWTRYHGQLEGVTDEVKRLAHEARKIAGQSMHDWLDEVVRRAANEQLKGKKP